MRESDGVAYDISQDFFRFREDDIVTRTVPFPGYGVYPLVLPEVLYLSANFGMLELAGDFPNNWENWPVMSERMLACLLSVKRFEHEATPVVMLDDRVGDDERLDGEGKPLARYMKAGWVFVEPAGSLDIIDWERSTYEYLAPEIDTDPEDEAMLRKLVLTMAEEELPPLFRIRGLETLLFVSRAARRALDAMGARGAQYRPLDRIDLPVALPPAQLARVRR